jgi:hypothetical protein
LAANDAASLKHIYQSMISRLTLEKRETELTAAFAGLAADLTT